MTDHATWVSLTNDELTRLRTILHQWGDEVITKRLDQYLADDAKDQAFRDAAEKLSFVREGECEVDDHAVVSPSDEGAYVMAWVWVDRNDAYPCDHEFEEDEVMIDVCTKCGAEGPC